MARVASPGEQRRKRRRRSALGSSPDACAAPALTPRAAVPCFLPHRCGKEPPESLKSSLTSSTRAAVLLDTDPEISSDLCSTPYRSSCALREGPFLAWGSAGARPGWPRLG